LTKKTGGRKRKTNFEQKLNEQNPSLIAQMLFDKACRGRFPGGFIFRFGGELYLKSSRYFLKRSVLH
jgi:hypothetical protein